MAGLRALENLMLFSAYLVSSLAMLAVFISLYIWITPYDERKDIGEGKMAPAIALTGAMLGFTFPLLIASYARSTFVDFLAWSVVSCLVQLLVFWIMHAFLPRVIETNNVAGATCFAAVSICAGLINAASFLPG
jgi:putative membrane protein